MSDDYDDGLDAGNFSDDDFSEDGFGNDGFGGEDLDGFSEVNFDDDNPDAMGDAWLADNDPDAGASPNGEDELESGDQPSSEPPSPAPAVSGGGGDDDATEALLAALGLGGVAAEDEPQPMLASGDDSAQLAWRETYYVFFSSNDRPTLTQVEAAISDSGRSLEVENLQADEDGLFQSLLVQSPGDNSALEISYEIGDAVTEQSAELAKVMQQTVDGDQLAQLLRADARLDIMHFERLEPAGDFDMEDPEAAMTQSGFDPATLITVVEALAHLTEGLPVDPAAGELLI